MNTSKIRVVLLIIIAGLVGYSIGVNKINIDWKNFQPHIEVIGKEPPPSLMYADFSQFWNVLGKIENTYYDKTAINPQKVLDGAISGMVDSLNDPYTVYLPPKLNSDFKQGMAGKFEGIGAELGMKDKQIIVVSPLDGSPALKAGLKPSDAIMKVDGQLTAGWTLSQAVDKIRGPKGTPVTLSIMHKPTDQPVDIKIFRDTITINSVTTWTKKIKDIEDINKTSQILKDNADNKVEYIRLSQFGDTTYDEWQKTASKVKQEMDSDPSIKGIVFDLRSNPGGYLNDAVTVASEFIKDGNAVLQENKDGEKTGYKVKGTGLLTDAHLVVLINKGSASASEIVAGALRDHNRAKLVGETSFGKGTIQEEDDMGGGAGLHVTIAKWLTPNGTWVHNKGLTPDVAVGLDKKDPSHDIQLEKAIETLLQP